jgi:hypothetical protein
MEQENPEPGARSYDVLMVYSALVSCTVKLSDGADRKWLSLSFYVVCERQTSFSSFPADFLPIFDGENELGCRFRSPTDI